MLFALDSTVIDIESSTGVSNNSSTPANVSNPWPILGEPESSPNIGMDFCMYALTKLTTFIISAKIKRQRTLHYAEKTHTRNQRFFTVSLFLKYLWMPRFVVTLLSDLCSHSSYFMLNCQNTISKHGNIYFLDLCNRSDDFISGLYARLLILCLFVRYCCIVVLRSHYWTVVGTGWSASFDWRYSSGLNEKRPTTKIQRWDKRLPGVRPASLEAIMDYPTFTSFIAQLQHSWVVE